MLRLRSLCFASLATVAACCLTACSSGSATQASQPLTLSMALSSAPSVTVSALSLAPSGTSPALDAIVGRTSGNANSVSLAVTGMPTGVTVSTVQPNYGTYGSVAFASSVNTVPGVYPVMVTASDGTTNATATISLTITNIDTVSIMPASAALTARQDVTPANLAFTVGRSTGNTAAITVTATGVPAGLTSTFTQPGTGTSGSVSFVSSVTPPAAGNYNVQLTASDGTASASSTLVVTVAVVSTISNAVDTTLGIAGHFQEFMSTGFQPSIYNDSYFATFPNTAPVAALNAHHMRLQPVHNDIPWVTNSASPSASDWNFTSMEKTIQPVLATGDNSPVFQIAAAPSFVSDSSGHFIFNTANLQLLTTYAQNLVRYYNKGGFDWGGKHFQSPSSHPITWWAIFNEPNLNSITATQYVQMYNTLVPAMLSVDSSLKFVALELSDFATPPQPQAYLPTMMQPAASGGISAQMNAISTHFYGTCKETDTDATLLAKTALFVSDINYFRTELQTRSDLANVPVWVTENNVNADFQNTNGYSNCNPTVLFVSDARGTSGFFTAWRPLIFSQFGKAGNQALYHFLYEGSNQYGEVNNTTSNSTLAYWTDYWLEHVFPWDGSSTGGLALKTTTTESLPTVEILAVRNADNSVSLMVANYAVNASNDDNGPGAPRTVFVDISALGTFTSATQIAINGGVSPVNGPVPAAITPASVLPVTFSGYGTVFYTLKP